ncbi:MULTISPECIES: hypothetical protein [unclassified Streptomyces]|uniref:hypothetical protein n=1 Tax=unclassified Streptomyces TaxID=2593676 RepID=UPI00036B8B27|nr:MULTISPECIES: hypothetical protein [unclassified Streptomyces]MYX36757.1 hypothetical protein [Streptomyces sp. SID8377]
MGTHNPTDLDDLARDYRDGRRDRADLVDIAAASPLAVGTAALLVGTYLRDEDTTDALLRDLADAADRHEHMRADHRATDYGRDYANAALDAARLALTTHLTNGYAA